MGTIQSKIKDGYTKISKPLFKKGSNKGIRPIQAVESKIVPSSQKKIQPMLNKQLSIRAQKQQLDSSGETRQSIENSKCYPASAIGLIQSRINGVTRYSTGTLIGSNVVISTSRHINSSKKVCRSPQEFKFILDNQSSRVEFQVEKVYSVQAKDQSNIASTSYQDYLKQDYTILILKNHVKIEHYGTLGIDFNKQNEKKCQIWIYGFSNRNHGLKLESIHLPAKVSDKFIEFVNPYNFDVTGGPIIVKNNGQFMIIGLQAIEAKKPQLAQRKYLKFDQKLCDLTSDWLIRQEEEIDIRDKNLGKDGIKRLVNLKYTNLHSINISRNNIGTQGLKYFARCEWPNLQQFDIGGNEIKKEGVCYLVKIPMKNIVNINMWGNSIGSQGAQQLLQGVWKNLTNINLYNNNISNEGVKKIILADWRELQTINLGKNSINPQAVPYFQHSVWKDIVSLNLWGNAIKNEKAVLSQLNKYFSKIKYLYL